MSQKLKHKQNTYIWLCITKISNSVGRNDNFLAKARKLSILPTSLDIFDIQQHYICIFYIFDTEILKSLEHGRNNFVCFVFTIGDTTAIQTRVGMSYGKPGGKITNYEYEK